MDSAPHMTMANDRAGQPLAHLTHVARFDPLILSKVLSSGVRQFWPQTLNPWLGHLQGPHQPATEQASGSCSSPSCVLVFLVFVCVCLLCPVVFLLCFCCASVVRLLCFCCVYVVFSVVFSVVFLPCGCRGKCFFCVSRQGFFCGFLLLCCR
jgi:hypothetical protein